MSQPQRCLYDRLVFEAPLQFDRGFVLISWVIVALMVLVCLIGAGA